MPTNDNDPAAREAEMSPAEAHGQAALLLVESLIHGLCEKAVLSTDDAIEITERAISVQADLASEADGAAVPMWRAHALLSRINSSLQTEHGAGSTARSAGDHDLSL